MSLPWCNHVLRQWNVRALLLCALGSSIFFACGEEEVESDPTFLAPSATPLQIDASIRSIRLENLPSVFGNIDIIERDIERVAHVVIEAQSFSEFRASQTSGSAAPRFQSEVAEVLNRDRVRPIVNAADHRTLVMDIQRLDREWLVDWTGLDRDSPDNRQSSLSFLARADGHDRDFQRELISRAIAAARLFEPPPRKFVLGTEMDRYYLQNPNDWQQFAVFVEDFRAALRDEFPSIEVGVGINWSHFMESVVPTFVEEAEQREVNFMVVLRAWEAVLDPIYLNAETGEPRLDFYAFSSIPTASAYGGDPSQIPDTHYAGIPTIFDFTPERAQIPVSWFSIGWPITTDGAAIPSEFLERFIALNGGYNVDLVSWWGYNHLRDQECTRLRQVDIAAPPHVCFRGLYPVNAFVTGDSPLLNTYFGAP